MCEDETVTEQSPADAHGAPDAAGAAAPHAREMTDVQSWHLPRLIIAWAVAAIFGVLITVLVPEASRFPWLVLAIGIATLVTFALQLGTAQKVGFITRTAFSVAGSVVVIAVIDLISALVSLL